jgi:hypothetical protein
MTKKISFQPFGVPALAYYQQDISLYPVARDFDAHTGVPDAQRLVAKNVFVDKIVRDYRDKYWPEWLVAKSDWQGKAKKKMIDFTRQDFVFLKGLRPLVREYASFDGVVVPRTHEECFKTEDSLDTKGVESPFQEFKNYCPDLKAIWLNEFAEVFGEGLSNKVGWIDMQLKVRFQRPRPYQTACVLGESAFTHKRSATATHPSLIAGHCIEGLFGGLSVHLLWERDAKIYTMDIINALQQFSTDLGDRRVLAGVHYPSDLLITWLFCFELLPRVIADTTEQASAKAFLKAAIIRSRVWAYLNSPRTPKVKNATYKTLITDVQALLK